jgi:ankyrin repeat protein
MWSLSHCHFALIRYYDCYRYGAKSYPLEEELRLLPRAAADGQLEAVIRLVVKGADIHDTCGKPPHNNETPLYLAVSRRRTEVVKYLLRAGADPNKPNPNGSTPLKNAREYALEYSQWNEIVDLLLEHGARDT